VTLERLNPSSVNGNLIKPSPKALNAKSAEFLIGPAL
jgi:hypothetical protein